MVQEKAFHRYVLLILRKQQSTSACSSMTQCRNKLEITILGREMMNTIE